MGWMLRRRWVLGDCLGSEAVCGFVGGLALWGSAFGG